ncbi:MAG: hypothetical protein ABIZ91_04900 [Gemmatimonadaceae bacterium]
MQRPRQLWLPGALFVRHAGTRSWVVGATCREEPAGVGDRRDSPLSAPSR